MTLNCAHRGDSGNAPENTVAAFRRAVEIGVDMIEFDVCETRDGQLVLMHDDTVDRTTDGRGRISGMLLREVKALDAGAWFAPEFAGERVPTLAEGLAAISPPVLLNVHVKTVTPGDRGLERRVLELLESAGALDCALIVHHDIDSLQRFRALQPGLRYCLLPGGGIGPMDYLERCRELGFRVLQPGWAMVSRAFCDAVHAYGMTANVFWADEPEGMRRFISYGIDGILTNYPARLKAVLEGGDPDGPDR
jgi:glycerophosphoryl diester phosphodiesterase